MTEMYANAPLRQPHSRPPRAVKDGPARRIRRAVGREEGLSNKVFEIRPGVSLPESFGEVGVTGVAHDAWTEVDAISHASTGQLGRSAAHAAMFVTAFHEQQNNDLSKFSTGTYIYPDTDYNNLADLSKLGGVPRI